MVPQKVFEALHKTFWGTTKPQRNVKKKLNFIFSLRPGSGREGLTIQMQEGIRWRQYTVSC